MAEFLRPQDVRRLTVARLTFHLRTMPSRDESVLRVLARDPRRGVRTLAKAMQSRWRRQDAEMSRLASLFILETEQRAQGFATIAGVDEAGVAPLAGPVVAAAVILPAEWRIPQLDDSKRLTPPAREMLFEQITQAAVATGIGSASVEEIDRFNVLQATRLAHRRAIAALAVRPHLVLIDGRYPAQVTIPQLVIIDGDATCASIAAASIIAKVTRDHLMRALARQYPQYGFAGHKGYGTKAHLEAIRRYGLSPAHRRSFIPGQGRPDTLPIR